MSSLNRSVFPVIANPSAASVLIVKADNCLPTVGIYTSTGVSGLIAVLAAIVIKLSVADLTG
ncbi:MAG: hypothetical protein MJ219_03765 [Mycoplasmoidaceae bacterium]|nr:hypothetical protein [Mycoplasmoidaceae bacterium]